MKFAPGHFVLLFSAVLTSSASAAEAALEALQYPPQPHTLQIAQAATDQPVQADPDAATDTATPGTAREQRARAFIDRLLSNFDFSSFGPDAAEFKINRDYQLEADGEDYRVTFDEVAIVTAAGRADFGPLSLTVSPQNEDTIQVGLRLGETITVTENASELVRISIGGQDINGLWSERAQNFLEARARLDEVALSTGGGEFSLGVGVVEGLQSLLIDDDQRWSQSQNFTLVGLTADGQGQSFSLDGIQGTIHISGNSFDKIMSIGEDIQRLIKENVGASEPPAEFFTSLTEVLGLFERYESNLSINGIVFGAPTQPVARLDHLGFNTALDASGQGSQFSFAMEMDGLNTPMAPLPANVVPHQARAELAILDIPEGIIGRFIEIGMASEQIDEAQKDAYWQQQLAGLLMGSQIKLAVINSFIAADAARVDLSAAAQVEPAAVMGASGEMTLKIENMQTLIDLSGAGQESGVAPMLAMLSAFSDRTESDGKTIDTFALKFTQDGRLMLNGKDVTAMFMPQ